MNFAKGASVNGDFLSEIQTSFPSRRQFVFSGTTMLQRVHAPLCSFLHSIFHSGFQNNNEPLQNVDAQQPSANGTGAMQKHWGLYFDAGSMPRGGKGTQTKLDASGSDEVRCEKCCFHARGPNHCASLPNPICLILQIYAFPLNRMSQDVPIPPFLDSATLQKVSLWMGMCVLLKCRHALEHGYVLSCSNGHAHEIASSVPERWLFCETCHQGTLMDLRRKHHLGSIMTSSTTCMWCFMGVSCGISLALLTLNAWLIICLRAPCR